MAITYDEKREMNLKETELTLGLPGSHDQADSSCFSRGNKRALSETMTDLEVSPTIKSNSACSELSSASPPAKAQVVGWPPIRCYRKNISLQVQGKKSENDIDGSDGGGMYVKVSMDGAPYLRKIDLKIYNSYTQLLNALENMFSCKIGEYSESEGYINGGSDQFAPTYEDKDGDLMLVGDVPWNMFISSCKRLRIMKGSEAKGLACL